MNAFISALPLNANTTSVSFHTSPVPKKCQHQHNVNFVSTSNATVTRCMLPDISTVAATTTLLTENPAWLQKIADAFGTLNLPEPVISLGHPIMMGLLVLGMGLPGAVIGWNGRLNENKRDGVAQKKLHENIMLAFFLLAALGGTGGTLSTAMQGYDIWQSPHAASALVVLLLLGANSVLAYSGFTIGNDGKGKGRLEGRKFHAYFGIATMVAFAIHGLLGVQILLG